MKTKLIKKKLRKPLNCRIHPTTQALIESVSQTRKTSIGRSIDYIANAAAQYFLKEGKEVK